MRHLTSRHNPLVSAFRAVADGSDRDQILIDGVHLIEDALAAGVPLACAVVAREALDDPQIAELAETLSAYVDVCSATPPVIAALSPVRSASPIVALAPRPTVTGTRLFETRPALLVCAVDVQDPGNVGAIVRVAEAGGGTGVAVTGRSADPYGWKALRGSMGSAFRIPLLHPCDAEAFAAEARGYGIRIVATTPRGGDPPEQIDFTAPVAILVGSEGAGLAESLVAAAGAHVTIPMASAVESLNTAICAALLVYEARRQRGLISARRHEAGELHGLAVPRRR